MPSKIFLSLLIVVMFISCKEKSDIDDQYLNDIAKSSTIEIENPQVTNNVVIVSTNMTPAYVKSEPVPRVSAPKTTTKTTKVTAKTTKVTAKTTKTSSKPKTTKKVSKPKTFYSPWTEDTLSNDHKIIKDVRLMIANKDYRKAVELINSVNVNNPPTGLDLGHLYQFKGIVYYFLSEGNPSNVSIAADAFSRVQNATSIEKFKQLSLLWEGMLYETYSANPNDLNKAIELFDKIINEHAGSRFIADAVYYKSRVLRKLGKTTEADELITNLKNNAYPEDTDIYSHIYKDYVNINKVLSDTKK